MLIINQDWEKIKTWLNFYMFFKVSYDASFAEITVIFHIAQFRMLEECYPPDKL